MVGIARTANEAVPLHGKFGEFGEKYPLVGIAGRRMRTYLCTANLAKLANFKVN